MYSHLQDPNYNKPFTVAQIEAEHKKVKSGADFPQYIRDIIKLGVSSFQTFVIDSHSIYSAADGYLVASAPQYENLTISSKTDKDLFMTYLHQHQQGQSDYFTFCMQCATTGVEKWTVDLNKMTCTYYDKANQEILVENIPI